MVFQNVFLLEIDTKRIFICIKVVFRAVEINFFYPKHFQGFKDDSAFMCKAYAGMVRIPFLNEDMPVETAHFIYTDNADTTERSRVNIKDFALGNITSQFTISRTLESEHSDWIRCNLPFESAP